MAASMGSSIKGAKSDTQLLSRARARSNDRTALRLGGEETMLGWLSQTQGVDGSRKKEEMKLETNTFPNFTCDCSDAASRLS